MKASITLAQFYLSEALRLADEAVIAKDLKQVEILRKWLLDTWAVPHILPNDIVQKAPKNQCKTSFLNIAWQYVLL